MFATQIRHGEVNAAKACLGNAKANAAEVSDSTELLASALTHGSDGVRTSVKEFVLGNLRSGDMVDIGRAFDIIIAIEKEPITGFVGEVVAEADRLLMERHRSLIDDTAYVHGKLQIMRLIRSGSESD
jgi:hypothetical protein